MNNKLVSAILSSSLVLTACGGGSSSNSSNSSSSLENKTRDVGGLPATETPIAEIKFDHTLVVAENEVAEPTGLSLRTKLDDPESILKLQSTGFPNQITKMIYGKGTVTTDISEIEQQFDLFINPKTGQVEVQLQKTLDFENIHSPFALEVQLGKEVKTIVVNVYDIQQGTAAEPLVISSYNELKSFAAGQFVSDNIGFDLISNLPSDQQNLRAANESASSSVQYRKGLHIKFDRDIDASASKNDPWQAIEHIGSIDGSGHVIKNLNMQGFIVNPTRFYSNSIRNLGFVDSITTATVLSLDSGSISKVFFEGVYQASTSAHFAPFSISGSAKQIYSNVFYDVSNSTGDVRISGLINSSTSSVSMDSAYSNGALSPKTFQGSQGVNVAGLSYSGITLDLISTGFTNKTTMYSAIMMDFDMVNRDFTYAGLDVTDHRYGGLASGSTDYPDNIKSNSLAAHRSDYQWKFVNNRNQSPMILNHGNIRQDTSVNAGLPTNGPDVSAAAITEAELMQASLFTGEWANSSFDLQEGEYPVLKGMPYPHEEGASWMSADDPGVAYQRATYNKYLTAP